MAEKLDVYADRHISEYMDSQIYGNSNRRHQTNGERWHPFVGQHGGLDKLGSGWCQAANLSISVVPYASSGVRPARVE
jgi:hypothetical protein